jgi:hypothetical protein
VPFSTQQILRGPRFGTNSVPDSPGTPIRGAGDFVTTTGGIAVLNRPATVCEPSGFERGPQPGGVGRQLTADLSNPEGCQKAAGGRNAVETSENPNRIQLHLDRGARISSGSNELPTRQIVSFVTARLLRQQ